MSYDQAAYARKVHLNAQLANRRKPEIIRIFDTWNEAHDHRASLKTTYGIRITPFEHGYRLERIKYQDHHPYTAILCVSGIWYSADFCDAPAIVS